MSSPPPDPPDEITEALRVPITPSAAPNSSPLVRATVNITLGNLALKTKVPVPSGPTSLQQLLPVARAFTQAIVHAATEQTHSAGQTISCKNHCSACCKKLVPISEPEAHALADLIDSLPEPRRSELLSRFTNVLQQLAAATLLDPLSNYPTLTPEQIASLSTAYFHLQLPCPFLEEDSCSIYNDRPLVCREYLVTSDPALCADPAAHISSVKLPAYMSLALSRCSDTPPTSTTTPQRRRIPLPLALTWAATHPEAAPTLAGPDILRLLLSHLSKTTTPTAP